MRIFAAGVSTETNTFCPVPTGLDDFAVQRGADNGDAGLDLLAVWRQLATARGDDFLPSLNAWAQPGGVTVRSAFESLRDELLRDLRGAMPVDVVLLSLHGAMLAQGYDDCEQDVIHRVRNIVGADTVIGVELDLHCHLSAEKVAQADIVVTFKEYPHTDIHVRAKEVFDLAVATRDGRIRPVKALFDCRMLGLYPTSNRQLRAFVDAMMQAERGKGVLSISFGHGFQFADVPHLGAKVMVHTDNDRELAERVAHEFGMRAYAMRRDIGFDALSLPMDVALARALSSERVPVTVADQSDNVGAGAPGDSTFALRWLLERHATNVAVAIVYDPEVVRVAQKSGVGGSLPVRLGGKLGVSSGDPLDLEVTVLSLSRDYMQSFSQECGPALQIPLGDVAALHCNGIDIVVSSRRAQCLSPFVFSDLGIEPRRRRALVVKSTQHFHGAFAELGGEIIYMTAPGAVPPDPRLNRYQRVDLGRLYPWNDDPLGMHKQ